MDAEDVEPTLDKTFAFIEWWTKRDRSGAPKKKPESPAGDPELPDWMARWHAMPRKRTSPPQKKTGSPTIGTLVAGEGVYIGQYTLRDAAGKSLGKIFNVYAAPEDLPGKPKTYDKTLQAIKKLKNWHGHDGTPYATEKEIYQALTEGSYKGGWIMPPVELLNGMNAGGKKIQPDNLYACRDKGALRGTFITASQDVHSTWYWSSTEYPGRPTGGQHFVSFSDGINSGVLERAQLSCRPMRLVPVAQGGPA